jgi:hypothetical protein
MSARLVSIIVAFGMLWLVPYFLLKPDGSSIAVTYNGSYPVMEPLQFDDDCAITIENGAPKQGRGCDFDADALSKPRSCDVSFAFLPSDRRVSRLHARFIMLKGGKEIGRGSVSLAQLVRDPNEEERHWAKASFRSSKCDTEELRLIEATAIVDGTQTDLIATGLIYGSGIIPWLPVGSTIAIGNDQG